MVDKSALEIPIELSKSVMDDSKVAYLTRWVHVLLLETAAKELRLHMNSCIECKRYDDCPDRAIWLHEIQQTYQTFQGDWEK